MSWWLQFRALFYKNLIVLSKHPILNILRCFVLPVAYGIFLAVAQLFLLKPNNYGIGTPVPILDLRDAYDGTTALVWADATPNRTGTDIINRITAGFSDSQLGGLKQVNTPEDIPNLCPQNFNLFSECFAAVAFLQVTNSSTTAVNYTIRADGGLFFVDVVRHTSDFEKRILPLQWAIDKAVVEMQTGLTPPTPLEWPFTMETNEEQSTEIRLSYIRGLRTLLVLALFICYIGIAYQLPGAVTTERSTHLTSHMKAMGLRDSPRIVSWHLSITLFYLPAWIIVGLTWHYRIFTQSNALLILVIHLLLGLVFASWGFFISAPFGKSPQLAAVASTILSLVFAILALVMERASNGVAFIFSILFPPSFYIFAIRAVCGWENNSLATNALKPDPDNGVRLLPILIAALIDVFLWPWLAVLWERKLYDAPNPHPRRSWFRRSTKKNKNDIEAPTALPPNIAISIKNLNKTFRTSTSWLPFTRKNTVTAVEDLSFDIPRNGIFVLLGENGAGKSTTLEILGGLLGATRGSITFSSDLDGSGGRAGSARGRRRSGIGIVPQKNVLFPELTCLQTLRVWRAIKTHPSSSISSQPKEEEDLVQLLRDCDLSSKIRSPASTLSGGQKRKLQLAIGLVGGSEVVLVDECTSGVDPLSRRSLWRTLMGVRAERCVVFTTHFLDEADLLADDIAILGAPGKLLANGSPVKLKRELGEGYTILVSFPSPTSSPPPAASKKQDLLTAILTHAPNTHFEEISPHQVAYHLKEKDVGPVEGVLRMLDGEGNREKFGVGEYDILGTSIEDVFLELMRKHEAEKEREANGDGGVDEKRGEEKDESVENGTPPSTTTTTTTTHANIPTTPATTALSTGRYVHPLKQATTIFHKRYLIFKRAWLSLTLSILVAVLGSTIPLVFISGRATSCVRRFARIPPPITSLYFPDNAASIGLIPLVDPRATAAGVRILDFPAGVVKWGLGDSDAAQRIPIRDVGDNETFVNTIQSGYRNLSLGGVSFGNLAPAAFGQGSSSALVAWEASPPGLTGLEMVNLASNVLFNAAINQTGRTEGVPRTIRGSYQSFPPVAAGTLFALKWVAFFGAAMSVYPAFFALYVSKERRSSVQAMQFSNGLANPLGLYLGHLAFDSIFSIISASVIVVVFAVASDQFHGVGLFWVVLVLYGIASTLFAYLMTLVVPSPLAAFAAVAGYQIIIFVLYLAGYLLTLTYAKTSEAGNIITIIHFTISLISPVASITRAALVSVNLFSLLCTGDDVSVGNGEMGTILRYGGPVVYLFGQGVVGLGVLVWVDSGGRVVLLSSFWRRFRTRSQTKRSSRGGSRGEGQEGAGVGVDKETHDVNEDSSNDALRVLGVSKSFGKNLVVDDVSFGVPTNTIFALLGPNGAGKTTIFDMIRAEKTPDKGDILIQSTSVISNPRTTRFSLGVCPQFTAVDSELTTREHLIIYGRLKGLRGGKGKVRRRESGEEEGGEKGEDGDGDGEGELERNVDSVLKKTRLWEFRDRLASKLSGGNQRKLALGVALIGNPPVLLIDEFSTGIDAKMKREMWVTLRDVCHDHSASASGGVGKAVVITTHSMEEASALAGKVGILAGRMLAIGSTRTLTTRYASYEIHFSCRNKEEEMRAQRIMAKIPGSRRGDDELVGRFEVPVRSLGSGPGMTLAQLFHTLASAHTDGDGTTEEFTVEKGTLESVFMKVIREHRVDEEGTGGGGGDVERGRRGWCF